MGVSFGLFVVGAYLDPAGRAGQSGLRLRRRAQQKRPAWLQAFRVNCLSEKSVLDLRRQLAAIGASFVITCLCSPMFSSAESLLTPV